MPAPFDPAGSGGAGVVRKAGQQDTRHHNRGLVLGELFRAGEASRADLGRATRLTKVAVSDLVQGLIDDGLIEEAGRRGGPGRGKPATILRAAGAARVGAIDLAPGGLVRGALLDLRGEVVHRVDSAIRGDDVATALETVAYDLTAAAGATSLIGVGVGAPGAVDAHGVVASAPLLGWRDLDIAGPVARASGAVVLVENDANAAAIAERRYGGAADDCVLVQIAAGVGAGVLVGGTAVRGASRAAGEIGHVVVDPGGRPCPCGKRGCLETVVTGPLLARLVAASGDGASLGRAGEHLGAALAPVVGMLDVGEIVLSGASELLGGAFLEGVAREVLARTESGFRVAPGVRLSRLGDDAVLRGAGAVVLRRRLGVG